MSNVLAIKTNVIMATINKKYIDVESWELRFHQQMYVSSIMDLKKAFIFFLYSRRVINSYELTTDSIYLVSMIYTVFPSLLLTNKWLRFTHRQINWWMLILNLYWYFFWLKYMLVSLFKSNEYYRFALDNIYD